MRSIGATLSLRLAETIAFNAQFSDPLPEKEVIRATKSAEKAYRARSDEEANRIAQEKGYPAAGYNISNTKLIEWLHITPEEQQHLLTIIDANEKRRRKRIANEKMRREKGIRPREEYEEDRKNAVQDKLKELANLMAEHPGAKKIELANKLGVSDRHLRRLMQQLNRT